MNNINFQLTPSVIDAAKKRGIPVVQTVHDYQMICPNHLLYNFEKNEICEACIRGEYQKCIQNKCIHFSRVKSILGVIEAKLHSFLKTYQKVDLYICPSYFLEEKLKSAKLFYREKTKTIHNFISKNNFERKEQEKPYIAFAGRLSKEKGIECLAEAARQLPEYSFRIAGSGPDEALLDGIENVERVGFLTGQALRDFMGNAKILVVPSIWYENCPLSILESQSYGVPVLTIKNGGMAELVEDGVSGLLIDEPTPEKMASRIKEAMENEAYYQKLKENCEKEKDQILTVSSYSKLLMEEYQKIISR
jgi:glycosyltransferase involved in cell wall biosynthesis